MAPRRKLPTARRKPKAPTAAEPKAFKMIVFAKRYGVSVETVRRGVRDGRLAYIQVGKRKLVLDPTPQGGLPE
jgi:hypothetical protein